MDKTQSTELLFELSHAGRRTHRLPPSDVPAAETGRLLPAGFLSGKPPPLPEVGEIDLVRIVTARTSYFHARRAALDTLNELAQASANLVAATGLPPEAVLATNP